MSPFVATNSDNEGRPSMISESRKALVAAAVSFLAPVGVVVSATNQPLDWRVLAGSVITGLIGGGTTWLVRNGSKPVDPAPFPLEQEG